MSAAYDSGSDQVMLMTIPDKITLFDTTLRDGQLSAQVDFSAGERVEIAHALQNAGVDVIEVAYPGMRPADIAPTRLLARQMRDSVLCCLAGTDRQHIDLAAEALSHCTRSRIHIYLDAKQARSTEHREQTLASVTECVAYAKNLVEEVEFSPQDATRMDPDTLATLTRAALAGGADVINVSDTTGTATPEEIHMLFRRLFDGIPELGEAVVSLHGHNHMGRSLENALSAIRAGVRQIEGTINGVGPAGGNTDLVRVAQEVELEGSALGVYVGTNQQQLQRLAQKLGAT